jgi:hypothetical protein
MEGVETETLELYNTEYISKVKIKYDNDLKGMR